MVVLRHKTLRPQLMTPLMITKLFLTLAAILAGLSVGAGAFAAHALKEQLGDRAIAIFETGAKYQMYHALALLLIALLLTRFESAPSLLVTAGWSFIVGIVFEKAKRQPLYNGKTSPTCQNYKMVSLKVILQLELRYMTINMTGR